MAVKFDPILGELRESDFDFIIGDSRYFRIDQKTPQTMTGLPDGVLNLKSGVIGTRVVSPVFTYFV